MARERRKFLTNEQMRSTNEHASVVRHEENKDEADLIATGEQPALVIESPPISVENPATIMPLDKMDAAFEAPKKNAKLLLERLSAATDEQAARRGIEQAANPESGPFHFDVDALIALSTPEGKRTIDAILSGAEKNKDSLKKRFFSGIGNMAAKASEALKGLVQKKEVPGQAFGETLVEADRQRARVVKSHEQVADTAQESNFFEEGDALDEKHLQEWDQTEGISIQDESTKDPNSTVVLERRPEGNLLIKDPQPADYAPSKPRAVHIQPPRGLEAAGSYEPMPNDPKQRLHSFEQGADGEVIATDLVEAATKRERQAEKELQAEMKEQYPERRFAMGAAEQRRNGVKDRTVSLDHAVSIQIGSTKKDEYRELTEEEKREDKEIKESIDKLPSIGQSETSISALDLERAFETESERRNQDAAFWDGETGIMGVADGAGGHAAGELASAFAAQHIPDIYKAIEPPASITEEAIAQFAEEQVRTSEYGTTPPDHAEKVATMAKEMARMPEAIQKELLHFREMYTHLHEQAMAAAKKDAIAQKLNPEAYSRLTTVAMGKKLTIDGQDYLVALNVGDSRIKKIRTDGSSVDIIREHSLIEAMRTRGMEITPAIIKKYRHNIIAGLGKEPIDVPFITVRTLAPGEKVAFMTDGISDIDELNDNFVDALDNTRQGANAAFSMTAAIKFQRDWKKGERANIKNDDATLLVMENQPAAIEGMRRVAADDLAWRKKIGLQEQQLIRQREEQRKQAA
ncbi:MAG: hypothetical protein HOE53_01715 [Candidatus Magasanikbacteria bacterium]|jgi:serine/threonine protein phosphatase PrpC|nr:hypothetical protein [Candidatus Magasanikbacteria bacterium]